MKKKILVVDSNAKIGGIQKALFSLLKEINDDYEVTLLLLNRVGLLLQEIPNNVRVLSTKSDFRYMGMAQSDCKNFFDKIQRGGYALISKIWGRKLAVMLAARSLCRDVQEEYDVAISYSHVFGEKSFFAGSAEYVLSAVKAKKKLCYIHCDYLNSGTRSKYSDGVYPQFDAIICVSQSVRERFVEALPQLSERTYAVYNTIDADQVIQKAYQNAIEYDSEYLNLLSVARLTKEKGIVRVIEALGRLDTTHVRYFVVGDGIQRENIEAIIKRNQLERTVFLQGEDLNPYRHMLNADLLIVPSYHEAAPVVFQEAAILQLPVLTTHTLSADEMVGMTGGFVVENDDEALEEGLRSILMHPEQIRKKKQSLVYGACRMKQSVNAFVEVIEQI